MGAGLLVWSITLVREGQDLAGGVLFAALLNAKHLFACLAPVYFVYLLRYHCRCAHLAHTSRSGWHPAHWGALPKTFVLLQCLCVYK